MNVASPPAAQNTLFRTWVCGILCFAFVSTSLAIDFDSTFGSGGKFMTTFGNGVQPTSGGSQLFIQPSGRLVIIGTHTQDGAAGRVSGIGLVGLTSGGALDSTFGSTGKVLVWNSNFSRYLTRATMLPDGSIVALCQTWESVATNGPIMIKFTPDGQVDANFSPDLAITPNETSPIRLAPGNGGKFYVLLRNFTSTLYSLVRLNPDGSRDSTFGPNGVKTLNVNRFPNREFFMLTELSNGKLLIGGTSYSFGSFENSFIARLDSDTNLDRSFGTQGITRIAIPGGGVGGASTLVQPDGKVLIGGYWAFLGSNTLLMRLTPRGRLDVGFGTGGAIMTTFNDTNSIRGLALAPDGKITVTGTTADKAIPSNARLFVTRYSSAGVVESSLVTNFITNREAFGSDIVRQPDGKLVIAASTQNASNDFHQVAVARFNP